MKLKLLIPIFVLLLFTGCFESTTTVKNVEKFDLDISFDTSEHAIYREQTGNITITYIYNIDDEEFSNYTDPTILFYVTIIPPVGSEKDDDATLFFEARDYEKRVFRQSNGIYQIIWENDGRKQLEKGVITMDMIDFETLSLKLRFNPLMLEEIDGTSLNLYFYNIDESWTEEYTVNVNIIRISD